MRRKILIFLLGMMLCILFQTCNNPNYSEPVENVALLEFKYLRDTDVNAPNEPDPRGFSIFSHGTGGANAYYWRKIAEDTWTARAEISGTLSPYRIYVIDLKVTNGIYMPVGRRIFARIMDDQSDWKELTRVIKSSYYGGGEEAEFIFSQRQLKVDW